MNPSHNQSEKQAAEIKRLEREVDSWKARVSALSQKLEAEKQANASSVLTHEFNVKKATEALVQRNEAMQADLEDLQYNYRDAIRTNLKMEEELRQKRR